MKASIIISALTLILPAFAAPSQPPASDAGIPDTFDKRAVTHLFVCDSKDFTGRCENLELVQQQCHNLGNGWPNTISSAGPDVGTTCTLYKDINCSGDSITVTNPGISNLADVNFNDVIDSVRCS